MASIMVTGAAGFIGFHVAERLLQRGDSVLGVDNLNEYYDPKLKADRLERLRGYESFQFVKADLADRVAMEALFESRSFARVVHLAAQAGVRYSLENPHSYVHSNLVGTLHILEGCRHTRVEHLVYASSSSVYGTNARQPFSEQHNVDHPMSLYAATKKSTELMAHAYSHLYDLPTTGLRFFTVYGPWGRPDMALFLFARAMLDGEPIQLFNFGKMRRDFTYVDDVVEGVVRAMDVIPQADRSWDAQVPDPASSAAPYRVYNVGNGNPVELTEVVRLLEKELGVKARIQRVEIQPGDVPETCADVSTLEAAVGYRPSTGIQEGVRRFVEWYRAYRT